MEILSEDYGAFSNFVKANASVKKNQILGAVCMMAVCDPVRSPMDGVISKIYNYKSSRGLVDKGDPLYTIIAQPET